MYASGVSRRCFVGALTPRECGHFGHINTSRSLLDFHKNSIKADEKAGMAEPDNTIKSSQRRTLIFKSAS